MMLPSLMVAEFLSRCSANFVRNRVTFTCERWAEGRKIRLNDKLTVMRRKDGSRTVNKFLNRKRKEGARSVYPALHNGVNETNLCNSVISLRNSLFAEMFVPDVIVVEFRDLFESLSIYIAGTRLKLFLLQGHPEMEFTARGPKNRAISGVIQEQIG